MLTRSTSRPMTSTTTLMQRPRAPASISCIPLPRRTPTSSTPATVETSVVVRASVSGADRSGGRGERRPHARMPSAMGAGRARWTTRPTARTAGGTSTPRRDTTTTPSTQAKSTTDSATAASSSPPSRTAAVSGSVTAVPVATTTTSSSGHPGPSCAASGTTSSQSSRAVTAPSRAASTSRRVIGRAARDRDGATAKATSSSGVTAEASRSPGDGKPRVPARAWAPLRAWARP